MDNIPNSVLTRIFGWRFFLINSDNEFPNEVSSSGTTLALKSGVSEKSYLMLFFE